MLDFPESSEHKETMPLLSKCRSKNGSQAAGSGGCGCKQRGLQAPAADESSRLPEVAPVATTALLAATETAIQAETIEETSRPKPACGCGHHAADSLGPDPFRVRAAAIASGIHGVRNNLAAAWDLGMVRVHSSALGSGRSLTLLSAFMAWPE